MLEVLSTSLVWSSTPQFHPHMYNGNIKERWVQTFIIIKIKSWKTLWQLGTTNTNFRKLIFFKTPEHAPLYHVLGFGHSFCHKSFTKWKRYWHILDDTLLWILLRQDFWKNKLKYFSNEWLKIGWCANWGVWHKNYQIDF